MADFIVSGQIPGTQFQITFLIWALVIVLGIAMFIVRASYRSQSFKAWIVTTRIMLAIRSRNVVRG
ncbi:MAG TPA: hypothetical protein VLG16_03855 [Candidatus Saccharimonadales bacterium]|nr:hypothetical protein [Candidatus Saccharimonadales bacterium]